MSGISAQIFYNYSNFLFKIIFVLLKVIILRKKTKQQQQKQNKIQNKKNKLQWQLLVQGGSLLQRIKTTVVYTDRTVQGYLQRRGYNLASVQLRTELSQNYSQFTDQYSGEENQLLPSIKFLMCFEVTVGILSKNGIH